MRDLLSPAPGVTDRGAGGPPLLVGRHERKWRSCETLDVDHRDVRLRIEEDDRSGVLARRIEDRDGVAAGNDVRVGDHGGGCRHPTATQLRAAARGNDY